MKLLKKIDEILEKIIVAIACFGMASVTLIICIQVIYRYILGSSLAWAEELSLYIEIYIVFLGSAFALGRGQHVCMDLVVSKVPWPLTVVFGKITAIVCVAFSVAMTYYCTVYLLAETGQKMAALPGYRWMVYLAMVLGGGLMVIYSVVLLLKKPEHAPTAPENAGVEEEL